MKDGTTRPALSEEQRQAFEKASKSIAKSFAPYIAAYRALVKKLRTEGFRVRLLTIAAPIQLQGHLPSGEAFYFRCRYDTCALRIAPSRKNPVTASTWENSLSRWGQYDAGGLDAVEGEAVFRELLRNYFSEKEPGLASRSTAADPGQDATPILSSD